MPLLTRRFCGVRSRITVYGAGWVTALLARLTAVCASNRPLIDAPVSSTIAVLQSTMPSACEVVPRLTAPATCQKTFFG